MATADALIGLGTPAEVAKRQGWQPVALTTSGTTQGSGTGVLRGLGNQLVTATVHAGTGAITLPADAEVGDEILIVNASANAGAIFPPSGGNINGETTDSGTVTLAASGSAGSSAWLVKVSSLRWASFSAAVA
jgi:hypothetical protein